MAAALRAQAAGAEIQRTSSTWGVKYVASGEMDAPNGRSYKIVSVWIEEGSLVRLVTAYPSKERDE
ncbi:MAG: DUF6883 domain-containing protein [Burkholderiales bacterium]